MGDKMDKLEIKNKNFAEIVTLINNTKQNVIHLANTALITLYWQVGKYISDKIAASEWGDGVVKELALYIEKTQPELKGFSDKNLWRMKQFYETYRENEILSPLVREISWTNNLVIMSRTKSTEEKEFYLRLCINDRLSKRELERQIDSALYERSKTQPKVSSLLKEIAPVYHRELQCLVAFELKMEQFKPEHLGQLDFYLEALDRDVKKAKENPSIGVLLCKDKDDEVVEYALSRSLSPTMVAEYKLCLPDKKLLQQKMHEICEATQSEEEA